MIGEVGVSLLISDNAWEEMMSEQRYQHVMLAKSTKDGLA